MRRALALVAVVCVVLSATATPALAQSSGMTTIPDGNVTTDAQAGSLPVSVSELRGSVETSRHASTTELTLTTPDRAADVASDAQVVGGGDVALVISDDTNPDGREVAIPTDVVRQLYDGDLPSLIYGAHSSGDTWTRAATYENGNLVLSFDEFSSNTVTFSGTYSLQATPAVDGATFNYPVTDVDSVSDFDINLTGTITTESETESGTLSASGSSSINVAGNRDPTATDLTLTGGTTTRASAFSADDVTNSLYGDTGTDTEHQLDNAPDTIDKIRVYQATETGTDGTVDIYIVEESPDGTYGEGTKVATDATIPSSTGWATFDIDNYSPSSTPITVEFRTTSATNDAGDTKGRATYVDSGKYSDDGTTFDQVVDIELESPPPASVSASTASVSSTSFGAFTDGESKTKSFPVSTSDSDLSVAWDGNGTVDYALAYTERTETDTVAVEVNGNTATYSGTLSDGTTTSLSTDPAWIASGENSVNVSVGDGTLSADAPTPAVDLDYTHTIEDDIAVDYTGGTWTEQYEVSRTYASAQSSAQLTIPLDEAATRVEYVETASNGGAYSAVDSSDYSFDDSSDTITVDIGDVSAGEEVSVRASASKLKVAAGAVEVTEPSLPNEAFEPKFKATASTTPELLVNATPAGATMAYTFEESWGDDSEYAVATAGGENRLVVDGASTGETFRVSTIPVKVTPQSGDVRYHIANPSSTEPEFSIRPGPNGEDTAVDFNFTDAADDTEYELYSETRAVVVDSGTAESPLTLTDDDSEETLFFSPLSSGGGESSGGGSVGPIAVSASPTELPLTILALAGGVLALFVGSRAVGGADTAGGVTGFVGRLTAPVLGSWWGRIALAGVGLVAALRYSLIEIGTDAQVVLVAGLALGVTWLVLRRFGDVSIAGFATVAVPVVLLALEAVNPGSIAPSIGSGFERFTGLAIIAAAALAWRYLQNRGGPDTRVVFSAGGSNDD